MQKQNRHLREEDREVIHRMNKAGKTQCEIAQAIGFSQGSVSKELKRNKGQKGYRAKQAHQKAMQRKKEKNSRERVIQGEIKEIVEKRLKRKHSPEQISGRLRPYGIQVSHETIYKYIVEDKAAGGTLYKHLRINGKRRYRRRVKVGRTGKIIGRVGLDQRPTIVDQRRRFGDWEVDLIEGIRGSGFLLSLYERKSRLGKLVYLQAKGAESTARAIIGALKDYKVKTLTYDNGLEFARHADVSKELKAQGYFCAPYHSWEKGGVENFNGLVRQYFPKGSDFRLISRSELKRVEEEINQRPRKTLGYRSPSSLVEKLAA
jgi:IS30 family transposase